MFSMIELPSLATQTVAATVAAAVSILYIFRSLPTVPKSGPTRPEELLDALDAGEDVYYFGVGSNLSRSTLEGRSVCGKPIKAITMQPCFIRNCRLAFNLTCMPPVEPAFGSVEPLPSYYLNDNKEDANKSG